MELSRQAILDFITDTNNFDSTFDLVNCINSYDGSLDDIYYYFNDDDFFAMVFGTNVLDAVRAVCYGDYRYTDDFVRLDAYGNLESANMYEIIAQYEMNKEELADKVIELADVCEDYLDLPEIFYLN